MAMSRYLLGRRWLGDLRTALLFFGAFASAAPHRSVQNRRRNTDKTAAPCVRNLVGPIILLLPVAARPGSSP
jgi:hypothetical protein